MSASTEPRVAIVENGLVVNVIVASLQFTQDHVAATGQTAYDVVALPVSPGWNYDGDWLRHGSDGAGNPVIDRIERDGSGNPVIGPGGFANVITSGG